MIRVLCFGLFNILTEFGSKVFQILAAFFVHDVLMKIK